MALNLGLRPVSHSVNLQDHVHVINRLVFRCEYRPNTVPIEPCKELLILLMLDPIVHLDGLNLLRAFSKIIVGDTNMRKAGVDQVIIMRLTGHKTNEMFLRYSHIDQEQSEGAMEKLNGFLSQKN